MTELYDQRTIRMQNKNAPGQKIEPMKRKKEEKMLGGKKTQNPQNTKKQPKVNLHVV